jgi:PKD repeat protein
MNLPRLSFVTGLILLAVALGVGTAGANLAPTANVDGPYSSSPGKQIYLDASASSDPDGDALSYHWDFGDGITAAGAEVVHSFAAPGVYQVKVRVTDPGTLFSDAMTTATIRDHVDATAFFAFGINLILPQALPAWIYLQPTSGSFNARDALPSTLELGYNGQTIPALGKSRIGSDVNRDGVEEIRASFRPGELRTLFQSIPNGFTNVNVSLQVELASGEKAMGTAGATIVKFSWLNGGSLSHVAPNPLNPQATLSFVTMSPGATSIQLFDIRGRLVRTLVPSQYMEAGFHQVTIDGRNDQGNKLASGVYYYRVQSADGVMKGNVAILK